MSAGWFCLHRGWRENDLFRGEFSRADAWVWLIENAAWQASRVRVKGQTVTLERGELSFSQRFLAEKWAWSKSRVDRFIADLRAESMIETRSKIGATAGHNAGQGQAIITICNYAKYQDVGSDERGNDAAPSGATAGQQRGKEEQINHGTIEPEEEETSSPSPGENEASPYAFAGTVIRLKAKDLGTWRERYDGIADIVGELGALDDWLTGQDASVRKRWFHVVSGSLNKKHQAAAKARASPEPEAEFTSPC